MAIAVEGYDMFSAAQNVSESINIPSGTDYILVWHNGYNSTPLVSDVAINSVAMSSLVTGSGGASKTGLYGLANPTTGASVGLTATVDTAFSEGAIWGFLCLSGVNTSDPVRDSDTNGASATGVTNTLDCIAGDYVFVCAGGDIYPSWTANITGIDQLLELSQHGGMAGALVSSGTTIEVGTTNGNYSTNCCCTVKADTGGGGSIPVINNNYKQQGVM